MRHTCKKPMAGIVDTVVRRKLVLLLPLPIILIVFIVSRRTVVYDINQKNLHRVIGAQAVVSSSFESTRGARVGSSNIPDLTKCDVSCPTGTPCEYNDEVDFRVIVMTYNRPESVTRSLNSLKTLEMDGDSLSVEVWIDRAKDGKINEQVKKTAVDFQASFNRTLGRVCVHEQSSNAFIVGQWVDTWRPKPESKEIGLILEDDVDVSPFAYRWLKAVHGRYDGERDVAGVTLQMENINFFGGKRGPMKGPKGDTVFMYPVLGTWGYSPTASRWREFQDWHHANYQNKTLKPYVPNILPTSWYKMFERKGTQAGMWEQWHIYFCYIRKYYTVYSNLSFHFGKSNINLSSNRQAPGLHFSGKGKDNTKNLMKSWQPDYIKFPTQITRMSYDGVPIK